MTTLIVPDVSCRQQAGHPRERERPFNSLLVLLLGAALLASACAQTPDVPQSAWLYVVDAGGETSRILRVRPDGSGMETVLDPALPASRGILLDAATRTLVWASRDGDRIQRARIDANAQLLAEDVVSAGLDSAYAVALDRRAGHLYWSDYGTGAIHRASLNGADAQIVVQGLEAPRGIDLDTAGGWLYWTDVGTRKVQRARLDGSNVQDLLTAAQGLDSPYGVTVDPAQGFMYVADAGTGHILRARPDGTGVQPLIAQSGPHPSFIMLVPEEDRLYWTDNRANRIRRARLDGSQIEDVVPGGLAGPRGLVLVRG
jgi:low density lipoprotein receptor-related protein 5/6